MSTQHLNAPGKPDELDAFLDRALASYTPAEPRLGLENRVRARLAVVADSPHSLARVPMQLIWVAASVFAVATILLMAFRPHARLTPTNLTVAQAGPSLPSAPIVTGLEAESPSQPIGKPHADPALKPRLRHRSAEAQPSQQELIARLMANGPEAIASLIQNNDKLDKPISIQPLSDDPLVIEPIKITPIDDEVAESGGKF
jgi:hypothetical protein